jgi:hypothetical protein
MFKDFHLALAEESGRKTRNSGNIRVPRTGLRNGKVFSKSDSDEEDEGDGSDTSYQSSTESVDMPMNNSSKIKGIQQRHSLLELANSKNTCNAESIQQQETDIKQEKLDDKEGTMSEEDEEGSEQSTTNGEDTGSRKSSEEHQSPSQSPDSSGDDHPMVSHGYV